MARTLGQTLQQLERLAAGVKETAVRSRLTALHARLIDQAQELETELTALHRERADRTAQIADLEDRLSAAQDVTTAKPLDVIASFKSIVDQVQSEARNAPGIATTIKNLELEIRGIVQMSADGSPVLSFPGAGARVDPAALSTMKVSFAAVPPASAPRSVD